MIRMSSDVVLNMPLQLDTGSDTNNPGPPRFLAMSQRVSRASPFASRLIWSPKSAGTRSDSLTPARPHSPHTPLATVVSTRPTKRIRIYRCGRTHHTQPRTRHTPYSLAAWQHVHVHAKRYVPNCTCTLRVGSARSCQAVRQAHAHAHARARAHGRGAQSALPRIASAQGSLSRVSPCQPRLTAPATSSG
jgi:hypothetical protein